MRYVLAAIAALAVLAGCSGTRSPGPVDGANWNHTTVIVHPPDGAAIPAWSKPVGAEFPPPAPPSALPCSTSTDSYERPIIQPMVCGDGG